MPMAHPATKYESGAASAAGSLIVESATASRRTMKERTEGRTEGRTEEGSHFIISTRTASHTASNITVGFYIRSILSLLSLSSSLSLSLSYLPEDDDDHEALPLTNVVLVNYVVAGRLGEARDEE